MLSVIKQSKLQVLLLCATLTLSALLTACSPAIVGKWQQGTNGQILQFFDGGTMAIITGGQTSTGSYKMLDSNTIQITAPGFFGYSSQVYQVNISGDKLTLTTPDGGTTLNFNKVK